MTLKLGMRVKVKSTLKAGKMYKGLCCHPVMTLYKDKIGEICKIDEYHPEFTIRFSNDDRIWWWNSAMVDIITPPILKSRTAK